MENVVEHDGGQGHHRDDNEEKEQADKNEDLEQSVPERPGGGQNGAPRAADCGARRNS